MPLLPGKEALHQRQVSTPTALLFPAPVGTVPISTVGVYCESIKDVHQSSSPIPIFSPKDECLLLKKKGHYSCASLEGVASVTIFSKPNQEPPYCLGLIFEYTNGTKQALGQCGIGYFHEQRFVSPSHILHKSTISSHHNNTWRGILVDFTTPAHPVTEYIEMESHMMTGNVEFWFRNRDTVLSFDDE